MNHLNVYSPTKYRFLKNILISDMIGGFQETGLITVTAAIKGKYLILSLCNDCLLRKETLLKKRSSSLNPTSPREAVIMTPHPLTF